MQAHMKHSSAVTSEIPRRASVQLTPGDPGYSEQFKRDVLDQMGRFRISELCCDPMRAAAFARMAHEPRQGLENGIGQPGHRRGAHE